MTMSHLTLRLCAPVLLLLAALAVATGTASGAAPAPCSGMFSTDVTGDAVIAEDSAGTADEAPGTRNMDMKGLFLNYAPGADGKKVLTVNFLIDKLDKTVPDHPSASGGIWYYAHWTNADGDPVFVKAINDGSGGEIKYEYGHVQSIPMLFSFYLTDGDTTGSFTEGENGVVSIVVPEDLGGVAGGTLGGLFGVVDTMEGEDDLQGINHHADSDVEEPDVAAPNGKDYAVTDCPPPAPGGGTTTPPPPTTGTTGGGTTTNPAPAGPLPFKAASSLGSAKKAKKKRFLSFKVTASKPITNLKLVLRRGAGLPVGKASIKSLKQGTTRIKLKVSKKIKPGKYGLAARGTVDGRLANVVQTVKVKK